MRLNDKIEERMGWMLARDDYSPTYHYYEPEWPYEWPKPTEGGEKGCSR